MVYIICINNIGYEYSRYLSLAILRHCKVSVQRQSLTNFENYAFLYIEIIKVIKSIIFPHLV